MTSTLEFKRKSVAKFHRQMQKPGERHKARVRRWTRHQIKSGKISLQPCAVCASTCVQAHHPDYNQPDRVTFLCARHHYDEHRITSVQV